MDVQYDGVYSLMIGDFGPNGKYDATGFKDTWKDWHLIPTSRPVIDPPPVQENTIDIPGTNGTVDMTSVLLGYPLYKNRTGSIEFYLDHTVPNWDFDTAYDTLINELHGFNKKVIVHGGRMIQETETVRVPEPTAADLDAIVAEVTAEANDPALHPEFINDPVEKALWITSETNKRLNERFPWKTIVLEEHLDGSSYYYEGRLSVNSFKSDKLASKITLNYDLFPFKMMVFSTTEDWLWNPFDFVNGVIPDQSWFVNNLSPNSDTDWVTLSTDIAGTFPQVPIITIGGVTAGAAAGISKENSIASGLFSGLKISYVDADGYIVNKSFSIWDYIEGTPEEGTSVIQGVIADPTILVGDPRNTQFRFRFENHLMDTNNQQTVAMPYLFDFRPGRL